MIASIKTQKLKFILSFLCLAIILLIQMNLFSMFNPVMERINGFVYDSFIAWHLVKEKQSPHVIIIDIDEASIKAEGRWPWPRDTFARLLHILKNSGVITAAFDIVFSESESNDALSLKQSILQKNLNIADKSQLLTMLDTIAPVVDNDQIFATALKTMPVCLGYLFHHEADIQKGLLPPSMLQQDKKPIAGSAASFISFEGYNGNLPLLARAASHQGFVSAVPDIDGTIRKGLLLARFNDKVYAHITLCTIMQYLLTDTISLHFQDKQNTQLNGITVSGIFIPTNPHGQILIPFWGLPHTIDTFSATDILHHKIPETSLAGSIALIGSSRVLASDLHQTPIAQGFPGVEILANMISGILSQNIVTSFSWQNAAGIASMMTIGIAFAIVCAFLGPVLLVLLYCMSFLVILSVCGGIFYIYHLYIPPTLIVLLITLQTIVNFSYQFILERKQKNRLHDLFGQYIPASHIQEITHDSESAFLEGDTRDMSVFFADIRQFTSITELLDASEIKRLLNTFFTPVTDIIFKHDGTIDKYVGDMVMAFWGAPVPDRHHASHAIAAALDIQSHLSEINVTLQAAQLPKLYIGMGISSGLMNVGDMGSRFRRSYTVLGDTVNLGSRLQDLTKFYHVAILVSEKTRHDQEDFFWMLIDKVAVKGRHQSVSIYTPLGYRNTVSEETKTSVNTYQEALEYYYKKDWQQATRLLQTLQDNSFLRFLCQMYLGRITKFQKKAPPQDWDGTYTHLHK